MVAPSDASKVICSGDGLLHGVVGGVPMECFIDTQRAGPGELTAHCSGPSKVAYCELYDRRDGTYVLKIRPQETGRHVLQVSQQLTNSGLVTDLYRVFVHALLGRGSDFPWSRIKKKAVIKLCAMTQ